jgi:hypothetical protein
MNVRNSEYKGRDVSWHEDRIAAWKSTGTVSGTYTPRGDRAAGYHYEVSMPQAEFSLTQMLDKPVSGRIFVEQHR